MEFPRELFFPQKTLKIRLAILLLLALIISTWFLFARREKVISGVVLDCTTNEPIASAEVSVNQRGWGFVDGSLVWDKDYTSKTVSNDSGEFMLTYSVGSSANLKASKEGYMVAQQFESGRQGIVVKMLQGNELTEATYNCKFSSECLQITVEDDVQVIRNVCAE